MREIQHEMLRNKLQGYLYFLFMSLISNTIFNSVEESSGSTSASPDRKLF